MPDEVSFGVASFKSGGYVIIEDRPDSDDFFIIRQGKVIETRSASPIEEESGTVLSIGDFFGVISCMARRPRIETVQAIEDTSCIVVRREYFGALIQKNTPIALKILRYFGNQLRFYDSHLTEMTLQTQVEEDSDNIYRIGEHFFSNSMFTQASYAYLRYVSLYPEGMYAKQTKIKLAKMNPSPQDIEPVKEGFYRNYKEGQIIFLEHEPGSELFIIQEGKVKITKLVNNDEVLLAVLKKGDIFGEMSLLDNKPRSASAISFGATKLMAVSKMNFEPMVKSHPEIATKIIELLSERIWLIYKQLFNILIKDPIGKIYDSLYTQLQKSRIEIKRGISHTFDFGPGELLKFIGMSQEKGGPYIKNLFDTDKSMTLVDGKIHCKDVSSIETSVQVFKRSIEIERKRQSPIEPQTF